MKIALTGTMSVGKTSLVEALKQIPEFSHYYFATERSKYLRDLGIPLNTDSTVQGQIVFMAERSSELFNKNIITDRSIVDVMAFTSLSKTISDQDKISLNNCASTLIKEYDYIFYIDPVGTILEDNGVRCIDPHYRELIDKQICSILNKYSPENLIILQGPTEDRINTIKETLFR
jgi:nicotinamide riboside kinase